MKNILLFPLILITAPCLAQKSFRIGPRIGATLATVHYSDNPSYFNPTTTYKAGFEAGMMGAFQTGHIGIQPMLSFIQKGYDSQYSIVPSRGTLPPSSYSNTTRLNYLTAQMNFAYIQRVNGQGFQVFAGPYISCLIGGKYRSEFNYYTLGKMNSFDGQVVAGDNNPGTPGSNDIYLKRWDIGLQAGVGYQYRGLLVQVGYNLGLRNLAATYPGGFPLTTLTATPTYNRAFHASIAYLFNTRG